MQPTRLYVVRDESNVVPATPLDNVLVNTSLNVEINCELCDFYEGLVLTDSNTSDFYNRVVSERTSKMYSTTDHLVNVVTFDNVHFVYVSLDNSVRSNTNGCALYKRLDGICDLVNKISNRYNNNCIFFFSESSRPSFDGDMSNQSNITSWLSMRKKISNKCNLIYLAEKRNNEDFNNMAFGVSAFACPNVYNLLSSVYSQSILSEGTGSSALGVKLTTGNIIWAIHFPLDFRNDGQNNHGYIAMVCLQNLMNNYPGSVCAFGDFNTIPGFITTSINSALRPNYKLVYNTQPTFFGSYYDTIKVGINEVWTSILN